MAALALGHAEFMDTSPLLLLANFAEQTDQGSADIPTRASARDLTREARFQALSLAARAPPPAVPDPAPAPAPPAQAPAQNQPGRGRPTRPRRGYVATSFAEEKQLFLREINTLRFKEAAGECFDDSNRQRFREFRVQFARASPELRSDRAVVDAALSMDGRLLQFCGETLFNDPEMTYTALNCTGRALQYASPMFKADKKLVLMAVERYGGALEHAAKELQADVQVVRKAVKSHPTAIQFASPELRSSKEITRLAVRRHPGALQYAEEEMKADPEIVMEALEGQAGDPEGTDQAFRFASPVLKGDKDFVLRALRSDRVRAREFYKEADEAIRATLPWLKFWGAARSALACPGEEAPVVALALPEADHQEQSSPAPGRGAAFSCEAFMLSGRSFKCQVSDPMTLQTSSTSSSPPSVASSDDPSAGDTTGQAWARGPGPVDVASKLKMNDLAKAVLLQLSKEGQVSTPERVFLTCMGPDREHVAVSAWDWDRPVGDFLPCSSDTARVVQAA